MRNNQNLQSNLSSQKSTISETKEKTSVWELELKTITQTETEYIKGGGLFRPSYNPNTASTNLPFGYTKTDNLTNKNSSAIENSIFSLKLEEITDDKAIQIKGGLTLRGTFSPNSIYTQLPSHYSKIVPILS